MHKSSHACAVAPRLTTGVRLRPLAWEDATAVAQLAGQEDSAGEPDHWRGRLEMAGHGRPLAWGVEADGRLIAMLLGHARSGDFGQAPEIGWVEALAVDAGWQGQGLARLLGEAFIADCAGQDMARAVTLVDLHDQPLRHFFRALGFRQSPLLCLERRL